jgi:hypothetical protein
MTKLIVGFLLGFLFGAGIFNLSYIHAQSVVTASDLSVGTVGKNLPTDLLLLDLSRAETLKNTDAILQQAGTLEEQFFVENETYKQVVDVINVYESPIGHGYQTVEKKGDLVVYVGYGPYAKDYTYTIDTAVVVDFANATSTGI